MRGQYDPRQSAARAIARWGKRTTTVRLEAGKSLVGEWTVSDECSGAEVAEDLVDAAEEWCAASGRDASLQLSGYDGERVLGSMLVRVRGVATEGERDDAHAKLVAQLMAHNEKLSTAVLDSVRSVTAAHSQVIDGLSKRVELAERQRAEAEARARAFEEAAGEAVKLADAAFATTKETTGEKLMGALFRHYGIKLDSKELVAAVNGAEVPALTEGPAQS